MRLRKYIETTTKILISIFLIYILIRNINFSALLEGMIQTGWKVYVFSFVCYATGVTAGALKWHQLLRRVRLKTLIITSFKAQFYSIALPGQLFGEVSKVTTLHKEKAADTEITASVITDKITSLIATFFIGIIGIIKTGAEISGMLKKVFIISFLIMIMFVMFPRIKILDIFILKYIAILSRSKKTMLRKMAKELSVLYDVWKGYASEKTTLSNTIALGVVIQMVGVIQQWGIGRSVGIALPIYEFMWIYPAMSVALLLPISFGGIGVREVSLTGFLGLFGVLKKDVLVLSLIILSSQIFVSLMGAMCVVWDYIKGLK